ncbi:MAG: hypothetical protein FWH54_03675 [Methanobrevibacter sp.]|nr:hypothetical protein [Methanobrevibacter sp.]
MQGKKVVEKPNVSFAKKQKAEKSLREDEKLVDKYVVKTEKEKKESKPRKKGIFAAIAIICLAAAFITGIGFGIFNFDFQSPGSGNSIVTLNESAFPDVMLNNTNNTDQGNNSTNSSGNTNNDSNSNSNSNSNNNNNKNNNNQGKDKNNKPESGPKKQGP